MASRRPALVWLGRIVEWMESDAWGLVGQMMTTFMDAYERGARCECCFQAPVECLCEESMLLMNMFEAVYNASRACSLFCRFRGAASVAGGRDRVNGDDDSLQPPFDARLRNQRLKRRRQGQKGKRSAKRRCVEWRPDVQRKIAAQRDREHREEEERERLADLARGEMVKRPWEFDDAEEALDYGVFGWRWEDWRDQFGNALPGVMGLDEDVARPLAPRRGPWEALSVAEREKRRDAEDDHRLGAMI